MAEVTNNWGISIYDGIKEVVLLIAKPFEILSKIPLGFLNATVLDLIMGFIIIGIAVHFFWRSAAGSAESATEVQMQRGRSERMRKKNKKSRGNKK